MFIFIIRNMEGGKRTFCNSWISRLLSHRKMRQGTHHCLGISPWENKDSRFLLLMHGIAKFWSFIHIYNHSYLIRIIRTLLLSWIAYNLSAWMPQLIWSWNATDPKSRTELDIELKSKNHSSKTETSKLLGLGNRKAQLIPEQVDFTGWHCETTENLQFNTDIV